MSKISMLVKQDRQNRYTHISYKVNAIGYDCNFQWVI